MASRQHPLSLLRSFLREALSDTRTVDGGKLQADVAEHYGDVRDDVAELFCLLVPSDEREATLEAAAGRCAAASQSPSPLKIVLPSSTRGNKPEVFYDQDSGRPYSVKGDGETFWLDAPPTSASAASQGGSQGGSGVRFAGVATDDDGDDDIDDDNDDNDDGDDGGGNGGGGGDSGDSKGEVFLDRASGRSYSVSNKTGETFWLDELDSGLQAQYAAQQALADDGDDDEEDDVEDDVEDAEDGDDGGGGEGGDVFRQSGAGHLGFLQVKPKKGKKGTLMRSQSDMTKKMHNPSLSNASDRSRSTTVASGTSVKGPIRKVNRVLWDKDTGKPYSLDDSGNKCWI